jgi:hypothetical protein
MVETVAICGRRHIPAEEISFHIPKSSHQAIDFPGNNFSPMSYIRLVTSRLNQPIIIPTVPRFQQLLPSSLSTQEKYHDNPRTTDRRTPA